MNKFIRLLLAVLIIGALVYFIPVKESLEKKVTEEQTVEMVSYVEKIVDLNKSQRLLAREYEKNIVQNEKKLEAYDYLDKEFIPRYEKYVKEAEKVKITDRDIQNVHSLYTKALQSNLNIYQQYAKAYDEQDEKLFEETNRNVERANALFVEHDKKLRELAKMYHVKMPKK